MNKWETSEGFKVKRVLNTNSPMLVANKDNFVLIDTGRTKARKGVLEKLKSFSVDRKLSLVILTHTHHDHIENLESILSEYDAKILVHKNESDCLDMIKNKELIITFGEKYDLMTHGINGYVIHTPGHSSGSSSIVIDDEIAFIGDIIGDFMTTPWAKKRKTVSNKHLNSLKKLIDLSCRMYFQSHKRDVYTCGELRKLYESYNAGEDIHMEMMK